MPQMGYDTKTDRLTDCQSQCDFDLLRTRIPDVKTLSESVSQFRMCSWRKEIAAGSSQLNKKSACEDLRVIGRL
jgi:hypothetical protein